MDGLWVGAATALWLGILTSISPCPLATNIAAISFIARRVDHPRNVFLTGLLYTLGRTLTYVALGALLVTSVLSAPQASHFLQKYMNQLLGPILILVGMVLLELISTRLPGNACGTGKLQQHAEAWGIWGAALLGIVFALSFCPVSAALFFGSLIPLALQHQSSLSFPLLYGTGSGLPVLLFAVLMAGGMQSVSKAFRRLTQVELWMRRATGGIFIAVGIYYSLAYIFNLL
jgi:cytochrome c-type biogenesis protein